MALDKFFKEITPDNTEEALSWGGLGIGTYLFLSGIEKRSIARVLMGGVVFALGAALED